MNKLFNFIKARGKRELTFLAVGVLMLFVVAVAVIFAIRFLVANINQSFNSGIGGQESILRFEVERAEAIKKR